MPGVNWSFWSGMSGLDDIVGCYIRRSDCVRVNSVRAYAVVMASAIARVVDTNSSIRTSNISDACRIGRQSTIAKISVSRNAGGDVRMARVIN
jgi:hypothetical protein